MNSKVFQFCVIEFIESLFPFCFFQFYKIKIELFENISYSILSNRRFVFNVCQCQASRQNDAFFKLPQN